MVKILSGVFWFYGTIGACIMAKLAYNSGDYVGLALWVVVVGCGLAFALCRS